MYMNDADAAAPIVRALDGAFTLQQRQSQIEEDLFAGQSVARLFIAIVGAGTTLMIGTLVYIILQT